ncbi:MAG TPA: hypothetical protein VE282_06370 [Gemmatimonadales bacterium]|nr:hypothetical protein [Gemmatimonadales bacterium]
MNREPNLPTAEDATPRELWRASWRLLLMLGVLALLVVPLLRELPLGHSTRISLLAWMLVALALYWLYAGMGYRPLLLLQLLLFSAAAAFLTARLLLGVIDLRHLSLLRAAARGMILVGAGLAGANLLAMLVMLWLRWRSDTPFSDRRA